MNDVFYIESHLLTALFPVASQFFYITDNNSVEAQPTHRRFRSVSMRTQMISDHLLVTGGPIKPPNPLPKTSKL